MKGNIPRRKFLAMAAATSLPVALLGSSRLPQPGVNYLNNAANGRVFLFQGDSITDGNRGRNSDPNHIMGHGYSFSIASRIGADFPAAGNSFVNRGISGNKVTDLQQRWQTDAVDLQPDVLSILIGINDTAAVVENKPGAQTADEFENVYRSLLTQSKAARPGILFILGLPFVTAVGSRKEHFETWKRETARRAESTRKLAEEFNALLVDYPAVFEKAASKAPEDYWIWDGIHPTVAGHELMAREWIKTAAARLDFLKYYHY